MNSVAIYVVVVLLLVVGKKVEVKSVF